MINTNQNGGDGYSFNLSEPIAGNPGFIRYSNNIKPIFEGDLLDSSIDNYIMADETMYGGGGSTKKNNIKNKKNNNDCGCEKKDNYNSIYDLIKLQGGNKKSTKITQFDAIREVAYGLTPLKLEDLTKLNVKLFNHILKNKNEKKSIQFGGYIDSLESILAPLGRNNLLVLASLLLLHHFAVERYFNDKKYSKNKEAVKEEVKETPKKRTKSKRVKEISGGDSFISSIGSILAPIGVDQLGASILLVGLQQAFSLNNNKKNDEKDIKKLKIDNLKKSLKQKGGNNPLRQLIEPLGTNAFLAAGLLIVIERFFASKVSELKKTDNNETKRVLKKDSKKILTGGRLNMYYEKLFNLLAPITFNAFATTDFLQKMSSHVKK